MRVLVPERKKVMIDLIDKKIIYLLSHNARFSYSTIAKHVNLSREAVKQRIVRLQEKKVLLGFQTVVNLKLLKQISYHIFVQLQNPKKVIAEKFAQESVKNPKTNAILKYTGKFDFELAYVVPDTNSLNEELKDLSAKQLKSQMVCQLLQTVTSKVYPKCMYNFSLELQKIGRDGSFHSGFGKTQQEVTLDNTDYKILTLLANDARITMVNLASKLEISVDTVIYRIKKLIKGKIIVAFRPIINYAALDYSVYTLFFQFKNFTIEKEKKFAGFLKQHPNVLWSAQCLGGVDNITYIIVKNNFHFHDVITEFREKFNEIIENYESLLTFAEYKYTYFPEVLHR
ncbi:Lrp/AsnC family transcriptional regulator [Candidatus Woesearchaeota archaeon]|nr:Lrp/AsnC family transcriptional regulator [Candidatus Woesearchaeota archaeon]